MKKEINLEEIISGYDILEFGGINQQYIKNQILMAMKEACNQCLDLAAENAKCTISEDVNENSILQIKDWIK